MADGMSKSIEMNEHSDGLTPSQGKRLLNDMTDGNHPIEKGDGNSKSDSNSSVKNSETKSEKAKPQRPNWYTYTFQ